MGAWGEGMQANDTALDYVDRYRKYEGGKFVLNKKGNDVVSGKIPIRGEIDAISEPHGVLGVAEFFLDRGVDLAPARALIIREIKRELSKKGLSTWRDQEVRKAALLRFQDRVNGKKVDPKAVAADNEGLLSRMGKMVK